MARHERIAPILFQKIGNALQREENTHLGQNNLVNAQNLFKEDYYKSLAHNLNLYKILTKVLSDFQTGEILAILLKGISLAVTIYPDMGMRQMGDIDLLVRKDQLNLAVKTIESYQYNKLIEIAPWYGKIAGYHIHLSSGSHHENVIEIHWNLVGNPIDRTSPPVDWFWSQSLPWESFVQMDGLILNPEISETFSNCHPLILTPTATLLYLIAHLKLQHGRNEPNLLWYFDIHQLILKLGRHIDWDIVWRKAKDFNWYEETQETLMEVKEKFNTKLPDHVNRYLLDNNVEFQTSIGAQYTWLIRWDRLQRFPFWARVMIILAYIAPSPTYLIRHYQPKPTWTWPLYYIYRFFILIGEGLKTLIYLFWGAFHKWVR